MRPASFTDTVRAPSTREKNNGEKLYEHAWTGAARVRDEKLYYS